MALKRDGEPPAGDRGRLHTPDGPASKMMTMGIFTEKGYPIIFRRAHKKPTRNLGVWRSPSFGRLNDAQQAVWKRAPSRRGDSRLTYERRWGQAYFTSWRVYVRITVGFSRLGFLKSQKNINGETGGVIIASNYALRCCYRRGMALLAMPSALSGNIAIHLTR